MQMGKAKSNKDRRFHIGTASDGCLTLHTKPEKATRIEADAYGPVLGILCWNTLVTVMPGLDTKINAMSIMAVFHSNSCYGFTPIRTVKAPFTRSAPRRMDMSETLTDVPLISTSETDWPHSSWYTIKEAKGFDAYLHQHLGATSVRVSLVGRKKSKPV